MPERHSEHCFDRKSLQGAQVSPSTFTPTITHLLSHVHTLTLLNHWTNAVTRKIETLIKPNMERIPSRHKVNDLAS
jgi:hypothetical protein